MNLMHIKLIHNVIRVNPGSRFPDGTRRPALYLGKDQCSYTPCREEALKLKDEIIVNFIPMIKENNWSIVPCFD